MSDDEMLHDFPPDPIPDDNEVLAIKKRLLQSRHRYNEFWTDEDYFQRFVEADGDVGKLLALVNALTAQRGIEQSGSERDDD